MPIYIVADDHKRPAINSVYISHKLQIKRFRLRLAMEEFKSHVDATLHMVANYQELLNEIVLTGEDLSITEVLRASISGDVKVSVANRKWRISAESNFRWESDVWFKYRLCWQC